MLGRTTVGAGIVKTLMKTVHEYQTTSGLSGGKEERGSTRTRLSPDSAFPFACSAYVSHPDIRTRCAGLRNSPNPLVVGLGLDSPQPARRAPLLSSISRVPSDFRNAALKGKAPSGVREAAVPPSSHRGRFWAPSSGNERDEVQATDTEAATSSHASVCGRPHDGFLSAPVRTWSLSELE